MAGFRATPDRRIIASGTVGRLAPDDVQPPEPTAARVGPDQLLLWLEDTQLRNAGSPFPRETPLHPPRKQDGAVRCSTRSLAGKPLAGFRATPDRRLMWHDSACNTVQEPTATAIIVAKKTTTWGESGFPSEFLGARDRRRSSSRSAESSR